MLSLFYALNCRWTQSEPDSFLTLMLGVMDFAIVLMIIGALTGAF